MQVLLSLDAARFGLQSPAHRILLFNFISDDVVSKSSSDLVLLKAQSTEDPRSKLAFAEPGVGSNQGTEECERYDDNMGGHNENWSVISNIQKE